jgi:UDPglucose--hexose-1-phosphate uridylyltransferase
MSEIRQNMATKEWVIIATERARRPEEFIQAPKTERNENLPVWVGSCPFCPGNEETELERLKLPTEGEWSVRVVANRYPALREAGEAARHFDGLHRSLPGIGYHEILVEVPQHNRPLALQSSEEIALALQAFQLRGRAMRADKRIEQIIYFKNYGFSAGSSMIHPHAQIVALPVVPYIIRARTEEARRYFDDHGQCVICRMCEEEAREEVRVVLTTEYFTAFVPYAAFSPFHLWVVPRRHHADFLETPSEELRDLSRVLREITRKIHFGLNDPDYNYVIRSAPAHEEDSEYLHWYLTIIPRVTRTAGFEMGSGMFINTALPEASARFLREVGTP